MIRSIWLGYDPREDDAYRVACKSIRAHSPGAPMVRPIIQREMRERGIYYRAQFRHNGLTYDKISDAPVSTEFAMTRFLTPYLANMKGWALFMDCDVLARANINELFALADDRFAVQVVQHEHRPQEAFKMDGQRQTNYPRKNWSSVMLFNCQHPANLKLTPHLINTVPGRDLHAFCWLDTAEIGALPGTWNHLVGIDIPDRETKLAHFTLGVPSMAGHEYGEFADEWWKHRSKWAA